MNLTYLKETFEFCARRAILKMQQGFVIAQYTQTMDALTNRYPPTQTCSYFHMASRLTQTFQGHGIQMGSNQPFAVFLEWNGPCHTLFFCSGFACCVLEKCTALTCLIMNPSHEKKSKSALKPFG